MWLRDQRVLGGSRRHRHRPKDKTKPVAAVMQLGGQLSVASMYIEMYSGYNTRSRAPLDGASD